MQVKTLITSRIMSSSQGQQPSPDLCFVPFSENKMFKPAQVDLAQEGCCLLFTKKRPPIIIILSILLIKALEIKAGADRAYSLTHTCTHQLSRQHCLISQPAPFRTKLRSLRLTTSPFTFGA